MSKNADRTVREIDAMTVALQREGLVSKETLDWFRGEYRNKQEEEGKKQRHEGVADQSRM